MKFGAAQSTQQQSQPKRSRAGNRVIIDQSKKEQFNALSGLRGIVKKLRHEWTVETNGDEISDGTFDNCRLFIIPAPKAKFNTNEIDALRKFLTEGGSLLIMITEGGEAESDTNINFFLEEYGIMANPDSVIRTIFYKYFDPKEALVSNGIINRAFPAAVGKNVSSDHTAFSQSLSFVYPYGCTLNVNRMSSAVLSTGSACFPISRPVAAFHSEEKVFTDFLLANFEPNKMDAAEPELSDYYPIPDHIYLSEQLKVCLSEGEMDASAPLGTDFMRLFDSKLNSFDFVKWPKVIRAYDDLHLKAERLALITPTFEMYNLQLKPAVYPPNFRELPPPELELFDLDDLFSSREVRLAQLLHNWNKYELFSAEEKDIEYFIRNSGDAVDVTSSLPSNERTARRILEKMLLHLVEYKKNGMEDDDDARMLDQPDDELFDVPAGLTEGVGDFSDLEDYDD